MARKTTYRQCTLRKTISESAHYGIVSYLPAKYATLNRIVKLKDNHDHWEDGWKVISVGATIESPAEVDLHKAIRKHRESTGDSLPRRPNS